MAHYKGTSKDGARATALADQRNKQDQEFKKKQEEMRASSSVGLRNMDESFNAHNSIQDDMFKASTIGLSTAADFARKRNLVNEIMKQEEKKKEKQLKKLKKKKKREREAKKKVLTFMHDDDEEEELDQDTQIKLKPAKKMKKDPTVESHFLPDKQQEKEQNRLREELKAEWEAEQTRIKSEEVEVTYSYWDGAGHRFTARFTKGHVFLFHFHCSSLEQL